MRTILTLSNTLSLLRIPLAFLFLWEITPLRLSAIALAAFTDSIDGYLARRQNQVSKFGTILDPATDKFFVFFVLGIFLSEGKLSWSEAVLMCSRDFGLCLFGLYLFLAGLWHSYQFRAIRWGKITTALQFLTLIALTCNVTIPDPFFYTFVLFGGLAFTELLNRQKCTS